MDDSPLANDVDALAKGRFGKRKPEERGRSNSGASKAIPTSYGLQDIAHIGVSRSNKPQSIERSLSRAW